LSRVAGIALVLLTAHPDSANLRPQTLDTGVTSSALTFVTEATISDLQKVKTPSELIVVSESAKVTAAPSPESQLIRKLGIGDRVNALAFVPGAAQHRDCHAVPFSGCIESSDVWIRTALDQGKIGFTPLTDFRAPDNLKATRADFYTVFGFPILDKNELPPGVSEKSFAADSSHPDVLGAGAALAKVVLPPRMVTVSRRELEYFVRESYPSVNARFKYEGEPQRKPPEWSWLPPLVQNVRFDPPLRTVVIYKDRPAVESLSELSAFQYLSGYSGKSGDAIPLLYDLPQTWKGARALIFLTASAAREINPAKIAVLRTQENNTSGGSENTVTTTTIDLNGDGQPEVRLIDVVSRFPENCERGNWPCTGSVVSIFLRSKGRWYKTGEVRKGHEGVEGF